MGLPLQIYSKDLFDEIFSLTVIGTEAIQKMPQLNSCNRAMFTTTRSRTWTWTLLQYDTDCNVNMETDTEITNTKIMVYEREHLHVHFLAQQKN